MLWVEGSPRLDCVDDSMVLNPHRKYYARLKETMTTLYEDVFWPQDAVFMERNSRDFITRIHRIDTNAEAVCQTLLSSPRGPLLPKLI